MSSLYSLLGNKLDIRYDSIERKRGERLLFSGVLLLEIHDEKKL
jgi:hypothetical protein